ncbi:MAG: hypothetical protein GY936_09940 [Ignavibacteriae bacterium]|nr:hypothetical protein [Ignavibacteriota bacterium]
MKKIICLVLIFSYQLLFAQNKIKVPEQFSKIQDAINYSSDGDTIIVDPGRYFENINFNGKKIVLASNYILDKDVIHISSTIIDGSKPTSQDTGSVILFISKEEQTTVLQGFTITGGMGTKTYNTNENLYFRTGGGILVDQSSPTIINNIITKNESVDTSGGVTGAGGGGIRVGNGTPIIRNNIISHNTGRYAGGMMLAFCPGIIIKNNIITHNSALGSFNGGGGIYVDWRGVRLINNTIVNNHSGDKGGGIISTGTLTLIDNCIIYGNTADSSDPQIFKRYRGAVDLRYTNIEGGWEGVGNIDEAPLFTDSKSFMLKLNSPCIDAGHPHPYYSDPKSSEIGKAQFPSQGTTRNDMGVYGWSESKKLIANIIGHDIPKILTAIKNKNLKKLNLLVNKNNANAFDSVGVNLLTHAVMTKDLNIVKLFIDKGADPNLQNNTSSQSTPLMMATNDETIEIARHLIRSGADINLQDKNGDPAIHWSAYSGEIDLTKLLLDKGAKTNLKSIHADGVMQVALKEWQDSIVTLLIEYDKGIIIVNQKNKPLIDAVRKNDIQSVEKYLNKKNSNTIDEAGTSLLIIASKNGYINIVKLLLQNGANINAMNLAGHTALNKAVWLKKNRIAKYLIEQGADINKTDKHFILPPLVAAVRSNNLELGKILLKSGANINTQNGIDNFTPIIWAAIYENIDFVKLLLQYKPDLSIVSKYDNKDIFELTSNQKILNLLTEYENML